MLLQEAGAREGLQMAFKGIEAKWALGWVGLGCNSDNIYCWSINRQVDGVDAGMLLFVTVTATAVIASAATGIAGASCGYYVSSCSAVASVSTATATAAVL